MPRRTQAFQTIRSEGAVLPPDILQAIASLKVEGLSSDAYHLPPGTRLNEAISRSWQELLKHWKAFREARAALPESELTGTAVTNERWLLPLFADLDYGRLATATAPAPEIDGRRYPIERFYNHAPIHLIGCKLPLDRRTPGARGAATASPHSMLQEFLNRDKESLWGFLSNGLRLRLLRDNASLSRLAYIEFDVEAMMEGEIYADFALFWLVCHQSRIEAARPHESWMERWSGLARERGTRVLEELRSGVTKAIEALGRGFIAHPRNDRLRARLHAGDLPGDAYYRQLLRVVYRLLFLFVAEDRELLHAPESAAGARELYDLYYSSRRLRELAYRMRGSKHSDLWNGLSVVFDALDRPAGCPELALPALGSFLWRRTSTPDLVGPAPRGSGLVAEPALIANDDLLAAVRALAFVEQNRVLRAVDYRNLGSEELGSVYESLLELHPEMNVPGRTFSLTVASGHERKTTGSYYTPDSLVQCLLDSALEPVVAERIKGKKADEAAAEILRLTVCDPACGSGHFLIAAAHRLARHLARLRSGEAEPTPDNYQHALRDVIGHSVYGVDINPMAVELCKVALWMEAIEPGKPLSFLDHHIQCGNSLLGATPALLAKGIPDEAFTPIEGDEKKVVAELKKDNKRERADFQRGYRDFHVPFLLGNLPAEFARLAQSADETVAEVAAIEHHYAELVQNASYVHARLLADAWCAAFVWTKVRTDMGLQCPTERVFRAVEATAHALAPDTSAEVGNLRRRYQFFHWHLAFPDILHVPPKGEPAQNPQAGWDSGFDVVVGNPPWGASVPDRVKQLIRSRASSVRRGTLDTFAAFTEHSLVITGQVGRVGLVLPDILLLKNYPDLRLHLLERTSIEQIAHWGQVFSDASIDVCTIVVRVGQPSPDHPVDCVPHVTDSSLATSARHSIRQGVFLANKEYRLNLQLSPETQCLIECMRRLGPPVGDLFIIREGVHSGNVRDKLFVDRTDGEHCRPLIFGRDEIAPMRLVWAGKYIQLDQNHFDRTAGDYFNLGDTVLYARPKILVRRTGDYVLAAPDLDGRFCSNNFFILVPRADMPTHRLMYAAAALNSAFATLYFRTIQPRAGKLFPELKITHLEEIPIPFFGDADADAEGRLLQPAGENGEKHLDAFRSRLLARIRQVAAQIAYALEPSNA